MRAGAAAAFRSFEVGAEGQGYRVCACMFWVSEFGSCAALGRSLHLSEPMVYCSWEVRRCDKAAGWALCTLKCSVLSFIVFWL